MEKTLIKVLTDQGIFETDLTLQQARSVVKEAKSSGELLALPLNGATAYLNIDGENVPVINNKTTFLDLDEINVVGYAENTYVAIEKKEEETKENLD